VVVDGTLIPIDRVARDKPSYSGKHKKHGVNLHCWVPDRLHPPDRNVLVHRN
jgi:hypothetical protein